MVLSASPASTARAGTVDHVWLTAGDSDSLPQVTCSGQAHVNQIQGCRMWAKQLTGHGFALCDPQAGHGEAGAAEAISGTLS